MWVNPLTGISHLDLSVSDVDQRRRSHRTRLLVAVVTIALVSACGNDGSSTGQTGPATSAGVGPSVVTPTAVPRSSSARSWCDDAVSAPGGPITDDELDEISGVVASPDQPGILWVNNDSGAENVVWALDHDGAVQGRFTVTDARAVDWEDVGASPRTADEPAYLYLADTGDNSFTPIGGTLDPRSEQNPATIYRVVEPDVATRAGRTEPAEPIPITYEDGPRDVEAMTVDPLSGDLFLISKQWDSTAAGLYRLPVDALEISPAKTTTVARVADVEGTEGVLVTGADISPDGLVVVLRTYSDILLWDRDPARSLAETLAEAPTCSRAVQEPQGEAVAFADDALVTISEGKGVPLDWLKLSRSR